VQPYSKVVCDDPDYPSQRAPRGARYRTDGIATPPQRLSGCILLPSVRPGRAVTCTGSLLCRATYTEAERYLLRSDSLQVESEHDARRFPLPPNPGVNDSVSGGAGIKPAGPFRARRTSLEECCSSKKDQGRKSFLNVSKNSMRIGFIEASVFFY